MASVTTYSKVPRLLCVLELLCVPELLCVLGLLGLLGLLGWLLGLWHEDCGAALQSADLPRAGHSSIDFTHSFVTVAFRREACESPGSNQRIA